MTSKPIVFGAAVVRADGTATFAGALPLDLLDAGAHRIRVVGSRDFGTVTVNTEGSLHIPAATLRHIELFDTETTAVVEVLGVDAAGGTRQLVRYIPLHTDAPYWILLVLLDLCLLGLYLRRQGHLESPRRGGAAASTLIAAAVVVGWVGWTVRFPEIAAASAALLVFGLVLVIGSASRTASVVRRI